MAATSRLARSSIERTGTRPWSLKATTTFHLIQFGKSICSRVAPIRLAPGNAWPVITIWLLMARQIKMRHGITREPKDAAAEIIESSLAHPLPNTRLTNLNRTSRRESIRLRLYERFNLRREIANVPEWSFAIVEIRAVVVSGAIKFLHPASFHSQFIQCGDGSQPFCFRDAS